MSFKTSSVTTRMGVRDAAYKLGKLAELLTLGHGPVDSGLSDIIDGLATQMQTALTNAGYSAILPEDTAAVKDGAASEVVDGAGKSAQAVANVADGVLINETLVSTVALVQDKQVLPVNGGTITLAIADGAITATYTAS